MKVIVAAAVVSLIVSVVCGKITAAYTFKIIDGYVRDIIEVAKKSIRDAYIDK